MYRMMGGMTNDQVANLFDQIADLLEFQSANPFRIRAYRNGADAIRRYFLEPFREWHYIRARSVLTEGDRGYTHRQKVFHLRCLQRIAMRMQVDKPRRHHSPRRIDTMRHPALKVLRSEFRVAHENDPVASDNDIGRNGIIPQSIEYVAVLDQQVDLLVLRQERRFLLASGDNKQDRNQA